MKRMKIIVFFVVCAVIISIVSWIGIGWYMGVTARIADLEKENARLQEKPTLQTDADIISRVSTFLVLPPGEPKVVQVTDVDTLKKTQPFFENAQNGDKILVYPGKVILYSPFMDKVIEVAVVK